ncbi:MAG: CBS domain-containing protein [Hyphomicrobiales bacterium]|nr:CBS domain-containing protein [Hyphomicrobiales bacterium]
MTVGQILAHKGRDVLTAPPHRTLSEMARMMAERGVGAVVIAGADGSIAGIFSERDLVRALSRHAAEALSDPVSRHMSQRVVTTVEATSIDEVMDTMTKGRFRHLPVVERGRLVGIVSIGDVVKHRLERFEDEQRAMRDYIASA